MSELPGSAHVVVVGGGIVGCSVAYHLARRGCPDVLVLERDRLTSGTTWHAAGLVGQLRATRNLTRLAQYTTELFATLEADTGQATGFVQRGSIAVARTAARFEELRRQAAMARGFGLQVRVIGPGEVAERVPVARTDDLVGAHVAGYLDEVEAAQVLLGHERHALESTSTICRARGRRRAPRSGWPPRERDPRSGRASPARWA
ncbi:MAG: NAD(P)/FAD-dependent oxidoreductase [Kineosporiaceae bacterium]